MSNTTVTGRAGTAVPVDDADVDAVESGGIFLSAFSRPALDGRCCLCVCLSVPCGGPLFSLSRS